MDFVKKIYEWIATCSLVFHESKTMAQYSNILLDNIIPLICRYIYGCLYAINVFFMVSPG